MGNDLVAAAAPAAYGGLKPAGSVGADGFAAHDATKAWTDGGAGEALVGRIADSVLAQIPEIAAYGAEQAKQAVLEYMTNAFGDLCVVNGELCFLVDSSNNEASFGVFWKLQDTLQKAMAEAENAGDEEMLRAIGRFAEQISLTFRAPAVPAPQSPARPLRPGNTKPAAGRTAAQRPGRALAPPRPAS